MLEKYSGVLPLWLAPEQVRLLPIGEEHVAYAQAFADKLTAAGMRVTVDSEDKNIGTKIKNARFDRIPYMLIIGDNEVKENGVTVRSRKEGELGCLKLDDVFSKLITEVATKAK